MSKPEEIVEALRRLDELTRRLRVECPWDREQDERSIVPHTVEEAYELADAAQSGDDAAMVDELGDVLFQVIFISLLLEERGAGSLTDVAEAMTKWVDDLKKDYKDKVSYATGFTPPPDAKSTTAESK